MWRTKPCHVLLLATRDAVLSAPVTRHGVGREALDATVPRQRGRARAYKALMPPHRLRLSRSDGSCRHFQLMGSLNAEIGDEHHDSEQCQWSYSRQDERQKAQGGGGNGRSGPHNPMRAQHGDEQDDRSDPGGRADFHQRMSRVEAGARRPECASLCIGPTVAADCPDDAQIPKSDDEKREANYGARYPGVDVSSCFARGPKDHCKEERNREYDLGGLQVVGRVLPVRDDAVREHDLDREHDQEERRDRPPVVDRRSNVHTPQAIRRTPSLPATASSISSSSDTLSPLEQMVGWTIG